MDLINFFYDNPEQFLITVTIISLFIGSFLNVVIYRLPKMMEQAWSEECRHFLGLKPQPVEDNPLNLCLPASHCPQCKKPIKPWHNIPLFSYLWLRGRCAACKARIHWRYPFVEFLTAAASFSVTVHFGVSVATLFALVFTWILICLTFIDIEHHLLPDQLTLSLLWIGLLASIGNYFCTPTDAILGGLFGYLIFAGVQWVFHLVTGKVGMGQGDYKLLAALGAFFGWQLLPLIILVASLTGILFTLIHRIGKGQFKSTPLPFGPYLALAGWVVLLYGNQMMRVYLNYIS